MSGHSYVHPSHVEIEETTGHRPTRDDLLAEHALTEQRRHRARRARQHVTGARHDEP